MRSATEFLQGAGWGIWPTIAFGALALGLAVAHALRPRPQWMPLIIGAGMAMLFSGLLGFVTGCINCFEAMVSTGRNPPPDFGAITMAGVVEALANIELALVCATAIAILAGAGGYRARLVARGA